MTLPEAHKLRMELHRYQCVRCLTEYNYDGDDWHRLPMNGHVICRCLCQICWLRLSIPERLECYSSIEHHRSRWPELAANIWAGK